MASKITEESADPVMMIHEVQSGEEVIVDFNRKAISIFDVFFFWKKGVGLESFIFKNMFCGV